MARSIEAPFRREYNITSTGTLGPEEGTYVGDIKTIYVNIEPTNTVKGFIQGKIGREGDWANVPFTLKEGRTGAVDISGVEYIRFVVDVLVIDTYITIFGYYEKDDSGPKEIKFNQVDLEREVTNNVLLCDIKEVLEKIEFHLSIITGEE